MSREVLEQKHRDLTDLIRATTSPEKLEQLRKEREAVATELAFPGERHR